MKRTYNQLRWLTFSIVSCCLLSTAAAQSPVFLGQSGRARPASRASMTHAPMRVAAAKDSTKSTSKELSNKASSESDSNWTPHAPSYRAGFSSHHAIDAPLLSRGGSCGPSVSPRNRAASCPRCGVDEICKDCQSDGHWQQSRPMRFDVYGQGEYIGPARTHHVAKYRLRVNDQITLVYSLTRELVPDEYEFNVGDQLRVEAESLGTSSSDNENESGSSQTTGFDRTLVILPDGTITLPLIGQVRAAGRSVQQLREEVQERSKKWYKFALWTVTPVSVDTRLQDLRDSVDARQGNGGQSILLTVSPDGTVQAPALGSVCLQGLTLEEAKLEIDQRYIQSGYRGIEVTPILTTRAPTFVYVLGEVEQPGSFTLQRPTTVMSAIALAGGWKIGGNLRQIVVFRRAEDWRLVATKINIAGALYGNRPTPADEIFLRDGDVVLIPKRPIQRVDDAINLYFTQGVNQLITFGSAIGAVDLSFIQ